MRVDALLFVTQKDIKIFSKIGQVMEALPDIRLGSQNEVVDCHMLGRAFENFFSVKCVDGYYYRRGWRHSWLTTRSGNIIDHYPWGMVGGPLLVVNDRFNPAYRLYLKKELNGLDKKKEFRLRTQQVIAVMERTIKALDLR
ncbi:MAG: hypothetical protein AAB792_00715 [Patescibacteria group bacterium]